MSKKIMLSGIQASGALHIGNYFGALRQFVDLQDKFDAFVFIANLHALTTIQNKEEMEQNTLDVALDYLAVGLDPEKTVLFKQSDIPEVTELAWIFNCLVTMPWLSRAHAFKDKTTKGLEANVGLFDYPVLMAADILMYDTDIVPVGRDQKQHVEMAREIAMKFNNLFGETFKLPQEYIQEETATVPGLDGQKMSKSYKNTIPLFGSDEEIKDAVMSIVTDSSAGVPKNVYAIHKLFRSESELESLYKEKEGKYKDLKEALLEDVLALVRPMRARREELAKDPARVLEILKAGGEKARAKAEEKMKIVREKIGVS